MQNLVIERSIKKIVPDSAKNYTISFSDRNAADEFCISSYTDYITDAQYYFLLCAFPVSIIFVINALIRWIELTQMLS